MEHKCQYFGKCVGTGGICSTECEQRTKKQVSCSHKNYTCLESQLWCDGGIETMKCNKCGLIWKKIKGGYTQDYAGWMIEFTENNKV